jgi:hypothetical protein
MSLALPRPAPAGSRPKSFDSLRPIDRVYAESSIPVHISNYFRGRDIPGHFDITDPKYVEMCMELSICDAVDMAYSAMRCCGAFQEACGDGTMGRDVEFVIKILKGIRSRCVPQEFSAGILIMHLEILEGFSFEFGKEVHQLQPA